MSKKLVMVLGLVLFLVSTGYGEDTVTPELFSNEDGRFCLHDSDFTIEYDVFPVSSFWKWKEKWHPICELGLDPPGNHTDQDSIAWKIEANYHGTIFWFQPKNRSFATHGGRYIIFKTETPSVYDQWRNVKIMRRGEKLSIWEDGKLVLQETIKGSIVCNTVHPFRLGSVTMNAVEYYIDKGNLRSGRALLKYFSLKIAGRKILEESHE